ncbi:transmembrane [Olea europaea subsp. europaea]|uniref:Transmembrane n=1 Tax=Olea europaea subsp. europaea TaxID=158383 RepID=A0A8S0QJJ8_OLEEU|nr:transmembrane [Olea europaea subsp. europaea]
MEAPGNVNPGDSGVRAPPRSGQGQQAVKAAGVAPPIGPQRVEGTYQATPRMPSAGHVKSEVLHQRSKLPFPPIRMAIGGFAVALTLGYFTLYSKKKPEATALDVAKVATGTATAKNTHPRN